MKRLSFLIAVVIAALVIGLAACDEPKTERDAKSKRKALSDTATVLPPGVREQWFAAFDQAIKERLSVYKGRIRVDGTLGYVTYAPISNFRSECSPLLGISLTAARGGKDTSGVSIRLIGFNVGKHAPNLQSEATREIFKNVFGTTAPELGVSNYSPAARSLMDDLCRHLVDRLEAMRMKKTPTITPLP